MPEPPSLVLATALKGLILQTFEVSDGEARRLASEMVASGEWGSDEQPLAILDWAYRVKEELGETLRWRSEAERERFRIGQALSKHLRPPALSDFVQTYDWDAFRVAVKDIALARRASPAQVETLKSVANPAGELPSEVVLWKRRALEVECLIALVAVGAGGDPFVLHRLESLTMEYVAEPFRSDFSPVALLALVAVGGEAAALALRLVLSKATSWSIRLACLYALPESREDGNHSLIEEFRKWLAEQNEPVGPPFYAQEWKTWRLFMSCLTLDGLVLLCGQNPLQFVAPPAHSSPMIDWASERGLFAWLMSEARWLRQRGLVGEETPLRNRLVECLAPGAVEFCMERLRNPDHESNAHCAANSLLRAHPKPLSEAALDACAELARMRCHPDHYKQRIEALRLLVEGADSGNYPKTRAAELILELARTEPDPDVRVAAIDSVRWTGTEAVRWVLAGALGHESERIREAASRVVDLR